MGCASLESAVPSRVHAPNRGLRRAAFLMFNDCALQGARVVAEVFQAANELASASSGGWLCDVSFLLADGGMVTASELRVDKIARRTGMGNGDLLAKFFRKRMRISPTEFRIQSLRMVGEWRSNC